MSNPLFNQYGMNNAQNGGNVLQRFEQFKKTFSGDPQQIVQQMLNSGRITQQQLNEAMQIANQFKGLLK